jgi:hypothetical protein
VGYANISVVVEHHPRDVSLAIFCAACFPLTFCSCDHVLLSFVLLVSPLLFVPVTMFSVLKGWQPQGKFELLRPADIYYWFLFFLFFLLLFFKERPNRISFLPLDESSFPVFPAL